MCCLVLCCVTLGVSGCVGSTLVGCVEKFASSTIGGGNVLFCFAVLRICVDRCSVAHLLVTEGECRG